MSTPLVSVLIPCYNAEKYIGDALESVFRQTWQNIEIIVVDDGSTDRSVEVIRQFERARLKLFRQENRGASASRNKALKESQGDFIQYLDADDVIDTEKIRSQLNLIAKSPVGSVSNCPWSRFSKRPWTQDFTPEPVWKDNQPVEFLISSWMGGGMMPPIAWLTPRNIIEAAGPWNEELSVNDDGEFFTRVLLASSGIVFCPEAKTYYRTTNDPSISKDRSRKGMLSALRAIDLSCAHLLDRIASNEARLACACHYQRFAFDCYPANRDFVRIAEQRADALGGTSLRCPGGTRFKVMSTLFGWKAAKLLQKLVHRWGCYLTT